MSVQITLDRSAQVPASNGCVSSYTFSVTAVDPVGLPSQIFRMRLRPFDPTLVPPSTIAQFDGVCTPADLTNLPINGPIPPGDTYRTASILVTYNNEADGAAAWTSIQSDVQLLLNSVVANSQLSISEAVQLEAS